MKEFVFGSEKEYKALKSSLNDGLCHVYDCAFPTAFGREGGRIGFEKDGISYILYVDKGLRRPVRASGLLKSWLENGSLRFLDFSDMKSFIKDLAFLYGGGQRGGAGTDE